MNTRSTKNCEIRREIEKEKIGRKSKKVLIIIIICSLIGTLFYLYARFIGTSGLFVHEYRVNISNLPDSFVGLKIVHFTDLHYGTIVDNNKLNSLLIKINETKPDIIVFTGDLVDRHQNYNNNDKDNLVKFFNELYASLGIYVIMGNHDYNDNIVLNTFSEANVTLLRNESIEVYNKGVIPIVITGLDSSVKGLIDIDNAYNYQVDDEHELVNICLMHEPDNIDKIKEKYHVDLALAGHSHNGQVRLPIIGSILKVSDAKKYDERFYDVNGTKLYISGGIGTSALKIRFFNHPGFNLYRLDK